MEPSPEERFRQLFHYLDSKSEWNHVLQPPQLDTARAAAASSASWQNFLASRPPTNQSLLSHPQNLTLLSPDAQPSTPQHNSPISTTPPIYETISAIVRRRLAIFSVDQHMFSIPGAMPEDDTRYEMDQGLLSGDDGGYTDFNQLQLEESRRARTSTGVYSLLGDDDGICADFLLDDLPVEQPPLQKDTSKTTPKRPRRIVGINLSEEMELFIRQLRIMCEPHRDAAQEESAQKKGVRKNIHRKAVSANSVVEELKEMEYKARIGKFERVEECISAVSACIGNQDETFAEVLTSIGEHADKLREEYRMRRERKDVMAVVRSLTTGLLGGEPPPTSSEHEEVTEDENSTLMNIPFAESELSCWPGGALNDCDGMMTTTHELPRPPVFNVVIQGALHGEDKEMEDGTHSIDNVVSVLGPRNVVMKNVTSLKRLRKLRAEAVGTSERAKRSMNGAMNNGVAKLSNGSVNDNRREVVGLPVLRNPAFGVGDRRRERVGELEISNDAGEYMGCGGFGEGDGERRERALIRGISALVCMHGGFTECSSFALEMLTDVVEDFIERIGRSLVSCRENIDSGMGGRRGCDREVGRGKTREEMVEEVRLICCSGFRGGFADLYCYVKSDIIRTEHAIMEAEGKLGSEMERLGRKLEKGEGKMRGLGNDVCDKSLGREGMKGGEGDEEFGHDECGRLFGHMKNGVSIDVLGGWKVPREVALSSVEGWSRKGKE